jgi:hypothetical protein
MTTDPLALLIELHSLDTQLCDRSERPTLMLITIAKRRNAVLELLIAHKVINGFYNESLDVIIRNEPEAAALLQLYKENKDDNLEHAGTRGPSSTRLGRTGGGISANYREACRTRSETEEDSVY